MIVEKVVLTSISMKAKPGGFLATHTSETRPIFWNASSMSNLSSHKVRFSHKKLSFHLNQRFFQPFAIKQEPEPGCGVMTRQQEGALAEDGRKDGRLLEEELWRLLEDGSHHGQLPREGGHHGRLLQGVGHLWGHGRLLGAVGRLLDYSTSSH